MGGIGEGRGDKGGGGRARVGSSALRIRSSARSFLLEMEEDACMKTR